MPSLRTTLEAGLLHVLMGLPAGVLRGMLPGQVQRDGNTLAAETQMMLTLQKVVRVPQVEDLPVAEGRAALVHQAGLVGGRQPIGAVRDLEVDGAAGRLPGRLYTPTSRAGADPMPTLLLFHGGGWVYGDLESHDAPVRHLAEHSGVQVLAVDYRLAPEHPFPAAVEDAEAAYRWLVQHAGQVAADPDRLAVGGDSAGGSLAALAALSAARDGLSLAFQLLIYPGTDFTANSGSRRAFAEGFYLSDKFIDQCSDWYLRADVDRSDPRASVLFAEIPAGTAPALVVTAGFDPLRDEGEAYAAHLTGHGVRVETKRFPDMIHGFFNDVGTGRLAPAYNREIAQRLAAAFA